MNLQEAKPSVLFLNRVYPPAEGATGQLLADLASGLVGLGWRVTVLCWRSSSGLAAEECVDGVQVHRVRGLPFSRARSWKRALSYLSLYPALLARAWRLPRHDLVVTMTDPPLLLTLGPMLKKRKCNRVVHWAQDLYPEVAEAAGLISSQGLAAAWLRRLSTRALLNADRVVPVGRCMQSRLAQRGVPETSMELIPNWAPKGLETSTGSSPSAFRAQHKLEDRFVIMYSGNLGLAHRFEAILDAADILQERLPKALFLFVGDGPKLGWVRNEVARRRLSNVWFLPAQPRDNLAQTLAAAELHLASMRDDLLGLVVPSKVYGILAVGRPCVFVGPKECEVARVIEEHQCGSICPADAGSILAEDLLQWFFDLNRHQEAGRRAHAVSQQYQADRAVARFNALFHALLQPAPSSLSLDPQLGMRP